MKPRIPGRPTKNVALVTAWRHDNPRAVKYIAKHLRVHKGNIKATAESINIPRRTLTRWIDSNRELQAVVKEYR